MVASFDSGQINQSEGSSNNSPSWPSEAEVEGSSSMVSIDSNGVDRTSRDRENSRRGGFSGTRGGRGGRSLNRNQPPRQSHKPPSENVPIKLAGLKKPGRKMDISFANIVKGPESTQSDIGQIDTERLQVLYEELNITATDYYAALQHCKEPFNLLLKKRPRTDIETIVIKLMLHGDITSQILPDFFWQIYTLDQIEKFTQLLNIRNSMKLYVKVPTQVRLEATLQHYGLLRQLNVPKDAIMTLRDKQNNFKNDVLSAEFDTRGNILIFSFKSAFVCNQWKNQSVYVRGHASQLTIYDPSLKLNTLKGTNSRLKHGLNYVITLLKVDAGFSLSQLKSFLEDHLSLIVLKIEHAMHPIHQTKDMTSWRVVLDTYDCPAILFKKTAIVLGDQKWYIKHDRLFFNAPCFQCCSARHSVSRCPTQAKVKVWEENILKSDYVIPTRTIKPKFRKLVQKCQNMEDLIALIDSDIKPSISQTTNNTPKVLEHIQQTSAQVGRTQETVKDEIPTEKSENRHPEVEDNSLIVGISHSTISGEDLDKTVDKKGCTSIDDSVGVVDSTIQNNLTASTITEKALTVSERMDFDHKFNIQNYRMERAMPKSYRQLRKGADAADLQQPSLANNLETDSIPRFSTPDSLVDRKVVTDEASEVKSKCNMDNVQVKIHTDLINDVGKNENAQQSSLSGKPLASIFLSKSNIHKLKSKKEKRYLHFQTDSDHALKSRKIEKKQDDILSIQPFTASIPRKSPSPMAIAFDTENATFHCGQPQLSSSVKKRSSRLGFAADTSHEKSVWAPNVKLEWDINKVIQCEKVVQSTTSNVIPREVKHIIQGMKGEITLIPGLGHCFFIALMTAMVQCQLLNVSDLTTEEKFRVDFMKQKLCSFYYEYEHLFKKHFILPTAITTSLTGLTKEEQIATYLQEILTTDANSFLHSDYWATSGMIDLYVNLLQRPVYLMQYHTCDKGCTIEKYAPSLGRTDDDFHIIISYQTQNEFEKDFHDARVLNQVPLVLHFVNDNHFEAILFQGGFDVQFNKDSDFWKEPLNKELILQKVKGLDAEKTKEENMEVDDGGGGNLYDLGILPCTPMGRATDSENDLSNRNTDGREEHQSTETGLKSEMSSDSEPENFKNLPVKIKQAAYDYLDKYNIQDVYEHAREKSLSPKSAAKDLERISAVSAVKQHQEAQIWAGVASSMDTETSDSDYHISLSANTPPDRDLSKDQLVISPRSQGLFHTTVLNMQNSQERQSRLAQKYDLRDELFDSMSSFSQLTEYRGLFPPTPNKNVNMKFFTNMIFTYPIGAKILLQHSSKPVLFLRLFSKAAFATLGLVLMIDKIKLFLAEIKPHLKADQHITFLDTWLQAISDGGSTRIAFALAVNRDKWKTLKTIYPVLHNIAVSDLSLESSQILCIIQWIAPKVLTLNTLQLTYEADVEQLSEVQLSDLNRIFENSIGIQQLVKDILCQNFRSLRMFLKQKLHPKSMTVMSKHDGHTRC